MNFNLPALTIVRLYKSRWRIGLLFKWHKRNSRIKHFFGTTGNAVKAQIRVAIRIDALVATARKKPGLDLSSSQFL